VSPDRKAHGHVAVQGTCFSFQAPGFFLKLGCEVFEIVDASIAGRTQKWLTRKLCVVR
jgi:hypothetical protein